MNVLMISTTDQENTFRKAVGRNGSLLQQTSIETIRFNGLHRPEQYDLVMTTGFDLDEYRIDAAMLRGRFRDDVPVLRIDRV